MEEGVEMWCAGERWERRGGGSELGADLDPAK